MTLEQIAKQLRDAADLHGRILVALAGPPAAGKSTQSDRLSLALNADQPDSTVVVPMDGYHFDNAVLEPRGQLWLKGAPETFDAEGLLQDLQRIRQADRVVAVPVFDRPLDLARAGARLVTPAHRIIIVEGNYLLLNQKPWTSLRALFDLTIFLEVPDAVLEQRLLQRWISMGQSPESARERTHHKDMLNAQLVKTASIAADVIWVNSSGR